MSRKPIDKYAVSFATKNISESDNTKYASAMILMVLVAASYGCQSINSKAISPNADTVFYRINSSINDLESNFWRQSLQFLREKKKKLGKTKCYIIVDETYESYTGELLRKEKKFNELFKDEEKETLKYLHKYKPKKGDTGSYKYLVFAILYGKRRRVLRTKSLKRKQDYNAFIVKTLQELRKEVLYECALFDRGFYSGLLIGELKRYEIPFIIRARISNSMKKIFGFYLKWKKYDDFEIGEFKTKADLVLGIDYYNGKRNKWAFITNLEFEN